MRNTVVQHKPKAKTVETAVTSPSDFDPQTGLDAQAMQATAEILGRVLADCYQLFIKTQGVHWNITGPSFYGLHKLTETQYQDLFKAIDEVAERIRALGHHAPASYTTYGELATIKDEDRPATPDEMVAMLVRDNGALCKTLREGVEVAERYSDVVTADLLTDRLARHEQNAWMLKMHVSR